MFWASFCCALQSARLGRHRFGPLLFPLWPQWRNHWPRRHLREIWKVEISNQALWWTSDGSRVSKQRESRKTLGQRPCSSTSTMIHDTSLPGHISRRLEAAISTHCCTMRAKNPPPQKKLPSPRYISNRASSSTSSESEYSCMITQATRHGSRVFSQSNLSLRIWCVPK